VISRKPALGFRHLFIVMDAMQDSDISPDRTVKQPTWYRILGSVLMLPIGIIIVLILIAYTSFTGAYVPGEYFLVIVVLFMALFILRMVFWRSRRNYWHQRGKENDPATILREQYTRGELTKEQYDQMIQDFEQNK
jgi:uncharacterized membrane protein